MDEPQIKVENELLQATISDLVNGEPLIKDEPRSEQESPGNPSITNPPSSPQAPATKRLEPLWKICDDRPRVQQVKINEDAAEHSWKYFEQVHNVLKKHSSEVTSCETRLREIDTMCKRKKDCQIRIGFLGGTGTGKSSLINALLQMKVLPRNEEVASTAVPVEVSYNTGDDPEHRFKAVIEGISAAEFTKEIKALFKNKEEHDEGLEGEDDDIDVEAYHQMLSTIEKIKWLYPYLQSLDDMDDTSAEELLNEDYVQEMLDSKEEVKSSSESQFAQDIKQYIESSKPKDGDDRAVSLWPLVKVVRIYIKADILRSGIILVDLPGSQDTSAARVAVTENYRKNLTASIVCANAVRAGSDKVAQQLLRSVERRNMKLDGLWTSDSLFFVITKIDELMDYEAYIRDHENLQEANAKDMQRIQEKRTRISELQRELKARRPKQIKNEKTLETMKRTQGDCATQVGKFFEASIGHKRKWVDDLTESDESSLNSTQRKQIQKLRGLTMQISDRESVFQREAKDLFHISDEKERLEADFMQARSRVIKSCIQNRAKIHVATVTEDYETERRTMGQEESEKPLEIFSVSADIFTRLCSGRIEDEQLALNKGFSTRADTGIPALRDAMIAMTWGIRQQNARSFNGDVESCHTRMKLWSADTSSEYKMLDEEKAIVERRLRVEIKKLEEKFSDLHTNTREEVNSLIAENIYEVLEDRVEDCAIAAIRKVTRDWCLVPWNTHKAINRNIGVWTSSKGVDYDWNQDLSAIFLDEAFIKSWTETLHKKRPELLKEYEAQVDKLIADFIEPILTSARDIHPAIHEGLQSLRGNILDLRTVLKEEATAIFEDINNAAKEAHRAVEPEVVSSWEDIFEQCGEECGKGLFIRNKRAHREHVNNEGGAAMYQRAGDAIQEVLEKVLGKLQEKFETSIREAVKQLEEDLNILVERHSTEPVQTALSPDASLAKERLRKALQPHFDALEKAWGIESEAEKSEIEMPEQEKAVPVLQNEVGEEGIFAFNPDEWLWE